MFIFLIMMEILLNYDSGAIPPSLVGHHRGPGHLGDGIEAEFGLSLFMEGLLGSLVYLGLTLGCFFAGGILQHYPPKRVLGVALVLNCLSCLMFSAAGSLYLFLASRFLVGISQAFLVIYPPVWVDEFAPKAHCTMWMSLTQAGVPLGIMAGYAVAGFMIANTLWGWRPAFYAQTIALSLLTVGWFFIPACYTDTNILHTTIPASPVLPTNDSAMFSMGDLGRHSGRGMAQVCHVWKQTRRLFRSGLWLSTCMALCATFFVVTGIQLWITPYLKAPPISANMNLIVTGFTVTSATAPILGVLFGGWVVDRVGGYQECMDKAALGATIFGGLATACALASLFFWDFWAIMTFVWFLLFFGAGVVPAATGILLACVPRSDRSLASAVSMLLYNMLGYFAGPFISGLIAELAGDLKWSFRVIMLWSILALVFMALSWRLADRRVKAARALQLSPEGFIPPQELELEPSDPPGRDGASSPDPDVESVAPLYPPLPSP